MINEPENHAVTFLSQSAEWLFGIKRETISCAEDLFDTGCDDAESKKERIARK